MKIRAITPAVLAAGLIYVASASNASAFGLLDRVMYGGEAGCCAETTCAVEPKCSWEPTCCAPRRHRCHRFRNNCCEPKCAVEPTCCGGRHHRRWFAKSCCEPTCEPKCAVEPTCCAPRRHHCRRFRNNCCEPKCAVEPTCCAPRRHRCHRFRKSCCEPTCEVSCGIVMEKAPAQPTPAK